MKRLCTILLSALLVISCAPTIPPINQIYAGPPILDIRGRMRRVPRPEDNKLTLYVFWGSWCPQCISELPSIERLHSYYQNAGLKVVGIAMDDSVDAARATAKRLGLTFDLYVDMASQVQEQVKLRSVPCAVLLNSQGQAVPIPIASRKEMSPVVYGPINWFSPLVKQLVENELS